MEGAARKGPGLRLSQPWMENLKGRLGWQPRASPTYSQAALGKAHPTFAWGRAPDQPVFLACSSSTVTL